jgi:hypothetical protein
VGKDGGHSGAPTLQINARQDIGPGKCYGGLLSADNLSYCQSLSVIIDPLVGSGASGRAESADTAIDRQPGLLLNNHATQDSHWQASIGVVEG